MKIKKADIVFVAVTLIALLAFALRMESRLVRILIVVPMIAPSFFFVFALCEAFQDGIASAQRGFQEATGGSPWLSFGKVLGRRARLWLPLWAIFFIAFQPWRNELSLCMCISIAGIVWGSAAACFVWAPLCKKVWTLSLLTLLTLGVACGALLGVSMLVIEAMGMGGYMGLGHLFYAPALASGCLLLAAIVAGGWAWWQGNEWFRMDRDGSPIVDARVQRSKAQGTLNILIASGMLLVAPPLLNHALRLVFLAPSSFFAVFFGQGTLKDGPLALVDEFLLAPPYWNSYQPGWILPIVPGLLLVVAAWGLWKQRPWGRYLAIGFYAQVAFISVCLTVWTALRWLAVAGTLRDVVAIAGITAFGMLLAAVASVVWLLCPSTRKDSARAALRRIGVLFLGCVGVTIVSLAAELALNRMFVYRGNATYQGQTTGQWLTRLASRDTATRQSAMRELGKSPDSGAVLREIYSGKPRSGPGISYYKDQVDRVYWSRAHWNLFSELRQENIIGAPLVAALTELAREPDPDTREAGRRTLFHLVAFTSEDQLEFYFRQIDRLTAIPEADRTAGDWGYLGQAYYRTGRLQDSRQALETGIRMRGEDEPTLAGGPRWWHLVLTLARLGEKEQATEYYEQLVETMNEDPPPDTGPHKKRQTEAARALGIAE